MSIFGEFLLLGRLWYGFILLHLRNPEGINRGLAWVPGARGARGELQAGRPPGAGGWREPGCPAAAPLWPRGCGPSRDQRAVLPAAAPCIRGASSERSPCGNDAAIFSSSQAYDVKNKNFPG